MTTYCDHCGYPWQEEELVHYQHLPFHTNSSWAGESGSVCKECDTVGHENIRIVKEWLEGKN